MAGLWIRPPSSSVVKLSRACGGKCAGLDIDDVDDLTVDVVAAAGA